MAELPAGTVTLLFTDIEGSTRLLQQLGDRYPDLLARHHRLLRDAVDAHGGRVVDTQGDAFFVAFARAAEAVAAAVEAQRALASHPWPEGAEVRVRMGLHTGEPRLMEGGYVGLDLHRAARICAAGHGGQVLLSEAARALVQQALPDGATLQDLGAHRLKDLQHPERLFQLVIPGLPTEFPPPRSLDARPHNLPVQATPLLGREREAAEVQALLRRDDIRLVTLTGPGGTGKTRLGLHAAAEAIDHFEHGAFFIPLAPIVDPALVASVAAQTLGLRDLGGRSAADALAEFLRDKRLLLVLDNFEQILPAGPLVADLLASCPGLKVLVTSRAPLELRGEHELPVPPLAVPDPRRLPETAALSQYGAVALFIERATAIRPDFGVTNENAPAVAEICHRLDGLPLAIELAAARIRLLSPEAILARLERRLPLLTGGARDLPARQRTLRDTIGWSYDLLAGAEQRLFRRVGVFAGGWTLEAAEGICDPDGDLGLDVLDGLGSLAAKSLVVARETAAAEPRFGMLETIREFALDQLEASGEQDAIRRRHAEVFLALADEAELGLRTAEQGRWLARLELEHDNLRAALAWSHARPETAEIALRLAGGLAWFWYVHGHFEEGRPWLDRILARSGGAPAAPRGKALAGAGLLALRQADYDRAAALLEEGLALYRGADDTWGIGWCNSLLAMVARERGDYNRATALFEASATCFRAAGDPWGVGWSVSSHGVMATRLGDYDRAAGLFDESLQVQRQCGDSVGLARGLTFLGLIEEGRGNLARAESLLSESLPLVRELVDAWGTAQALDGLGRIALARGDAERAGALHAEALALYRDVGHKVGLSGSLDDLARVAVSLGEGERAARLLGATDAIRTAIGATLMPPRQALRERAIADACTLLGEEAFAVAVVAGRAMSLEQVVAYALSDSA